MATWRVAQSLLVLRDQIDAAFPERSKASDGTIGDAEHATRDSDHNPWYGPGIVTAIDITHDPEHGVDIDQLTDELQASGDPRIKYIIANSLIMSGAGGPAPWQWRRYDGPNSHIKHFHLSVVASPLCDGQQPWNLPSLKEDAMTPDQMREIKDHITAEVERVAELVWDEPRKDPVTGLDSSYGTQLAFTRKSAYQAAQVNDG